MNMPQSPEFRELDTPQARFFAMMERFIETIDRTDIEIFEMEGSDEYDIDPSTSIEAQFELNDNFIEHLGLQSSSWPHGYAGFSKDELGVTAASLAVYFENPHTPDLLHSYKWESYKHSGVPEVLFEETIDIKGKKKKQADIEKLMEIADMRGGMSKSVSIEELEALERIIFSEE